MGTTNQFGYVQFLNKTLWNYFVTLTTSEPMSLDRARRLAEKFTDVISLKYPDATFFWVAEPFDIRYGYHIHAVLALPNRTQLQLNLAKTELQKSWNRFTNYNKSRESNRVDFQPYDKTRKGVEYITKTINNINAVYGFYFPNNKVN